jgi:putative FmdB family regulatory protein
VPIYEYECLNCENQFESIQKITDEPLETCPSCSGKVKKLVSNCSFQLKGTGWYVTDYANKSKHTEEKNKEKKEKKKDQKASDKAESKVKSSEKTSEKAVNQ